MTIWGETLCELCRFRLAECELDGEPLCIGCADLVIERGELVAQIGPLAWRLAPLAEIARLPR